MSEEDGGARSGDARLDLEAARLRLLHGYRRMILLGKARLPWEAARRLVGPDCAFHLYGRSAGAGRSRRRRRRAARARR